MNDDPKAMDIHPALAMPPALQPRRGPLIGGSVLEVYQPTGMSLSNTSIKRHKPIRFISSSDKSWAKMNSYMIAGEVI